MANFTIDVFSSVARSLANNEEGVITSDGSLVVQTGNAVNITDSGRMVVLGDVVATSIDGLDYTGVGSTGYLTVGESGSIVSTGGDAVDVEKTSGQMWMINNGEIMSTASDAFDLDITNGSLRLYNHGVMAATDNGIDADVGSGTINVVNTGMISGATAVRLTNTNGSTLFNSGEISSSRQSETAVETGEGNDQVVNTGTIFGRVFLQDGDDTFNGINGLQTDIYGGTGDDLIMGGIGKESFYGGDDDDRMFGNGGGDVFFGGNGNDVMRGGAEANDFDGGDGSDWVYYQNSDAGVTADLTSDFGYEGFAEGDTYDNVENIWGSQFRDELNGSEEANYLVGGGGNDIMRGYDGNDQFRGDGGADVMNGGAGFDRLIYSSSNGAVNVNLTTGTASGGHATGDRFFNMEWLTGSQYGDRLTGGTDNNQIFGLDGNDIIRGYLGNDLMGGGDGADTFVFDNNGGNDIITDFENDVDKLDLRAYNYSSVTQVLNQVSVNGGDVFITRDFNDSIRLVGFAGDVADLADDLII